MRIFKQEQQDGLADKLSDRTISYTAAVFDRDSPAVSFSVKQLKPSLTNVSISDKSIADVQDKDLYFCYSVLVSTNWNANDDVFLPVETWVARHTPTHKPTNLDHDERQIVGHLSDCWVVDGVGNVIADDSPIDSLPDFFHIINSSVIYKQWTDPEMKQRAENLIKEIQGDKRCVSMECLFSDFDYASIDSKGSVEIIGRNAETSFLTKHLKAYGGDGLFKELRIGRALKNILFSGKGFVHNPANKHSQILQPSSVNVDKTVTFNGSCESNEAKSLNFKGTTWVVDGIKSNELCSSGVFSLQRQDNKRENDMADDAFKAQISSLEKELADARSEATVLRDKAVKAATDVLESKVTELESRLAVIKGDNTDLEVKVSDVTDKLKEAVCDGSELQTKLDEASVKVNELTAVNVQIRRISILVDGGVDREVAEQKVKLLERLDDPSFDAIAKDLIALSTPRVTELVDVTDKEVEDTEGEGEVNGDEGDVLEDAEVSKSDTATLPEDKDEENDVVLASVASYISNNL